MTKQRKKSSQTTTDDVLNSMLLKLPSSAKRVLLDIYDTQQKRPTTALFPVVSPFRVEYFALQLLSSSRATINDIASFFQLSKGTAARSKNFDISRSLLLRTKYRWNVKRRRVSFSITNQAIRIMNDLVPTRSGRQWCLLTWSDKELYRRYKEIAVSFSLFLHHF